MARFSDLVSSLHYCADTSDSTANKDLLTAHAVALSEASLSRQQVFGMPCFLVVQGCVAAETGYYR